MLIAFADMDDTFLAPDKTIPAENLIALEAMHDRGIPFVPCTGRPFSGIPAELLANPAVRYVVAGDGSSIHDLERDSGDTCIRSVPIGPERVLTLCEAIDRSGADAIVDVFADGHAYSVRKNYEALPGYISDPHYLASLRAMRTPVDLTVPQVLERAHEVERVTVFCRAAADRAAVIAAVAADPTLAWVSSYPTNLEVTDAAASKGTGLVWLCGHLGIDVADSVAFGDSLNDVSMLTSAGDGVAMANAAPEALAAADHVTGPCGEAGVGRYMEGLLA
ncbi:MAG: Cof-type HAD-IIB family hydrolase [Atopobiaceae bacterium]|nr:Cof-type HAD-IIB family hydrolase [Atopobiaceae bacterium]MCI2173516.1 Cof-type HAD-IIB family hydrolase [Atopobiaceae bacterium]MCI2207511.1 Cof-type HAD-IIB family hydrolase [Atopobiaceae bacterium]